MYTHTGFDMQPKTPHCIKAAALAVALLTSAAQALAEQTPIPPGSDGLESTAEGPWADLTYEEHLMKAVIEGKSRGPADDRMQSLFSAKTGSTEPVEVRAVRQQPIEGQPGCAVVFLYFVQPGVPYFDHNGDRAGTTTFEVRQNFARCANGDIPYLPGQQRPESTGR